MSMTAAYQNAIANLGVALITHIGLIDELGAELSGGTYARLAVAWTTAPTGGDNGLSRITADKTFNVPAGKTVGGWKGYSALTAGTDYGGGDLTDEAYVNAGTYTLLASATGIDHNAT